MTHRLWIVNDPVAIAALQEDFAGRKLYIADGHHRYETALRYRDHCQAENRYEPGADYVMMMLADMEDPGLVVFPTHRLVRGLENFNEEELLAACGEDFTLEPCGDRQESQEKLLSCMSRAATPSPSGRGRAGRCSL